MKKFQLLLLSFTIAFCVCAQGENEIDTYIQSTLGDVYCKMPKSIQNSENQHYLLAQLEKYRNDSREDVRQKTYRLIGSIAKSATDTTYSKRLMEKLVLSQLDSIYSIRASIVDFIIRFSFKKSQFTATAADSLYTLLLPENKNKLSKNNILLIGFVGNMSKCDSLYSYAKENLDGHVNKYTNNPFDTKIWASKLALARMGDEQLADECVNFMRKYKDDIEQYPLLCKYATYIRTNKAIDFLNELLNIDLLNYPLKPTVSGEPLARVALECLWRALYDMPQPVRYTGKEIINQIQPARAWMKSNKGKYKINADAFW
jgi:hypothetical protein